MSFLAPIFLFATVAAVLPVLFHLVRKMKAKQVPFSSLMFLQATSKELVRKRRLRDVLLMAVRACIFGLLALAFARPFVPQESLPFLPQRDNVSMVLLVDQSYSMQYGDLFADVLAEVQRRIDEADPNDEIAVIAFADEARQLTDLTTDRALVQNVVSTLAVTNRPTDFYKPLRMAEELLESARHEAKTVVLISDLQGLGWTGSLENWKFGQEVQFVPVKIAPEIAENAYLADFNLTQKRTGERMAVRYDARVAAQGAAAEQDNRLQLAVADAAVETAPLVPRATQQATFQQADLRTGVYQGTLTLNDDPLLLDNTYYFTHVVEDRPSLLFVDEGPRGSQRDAFFFDTAFNLGEDALYRFTTGTRGQLSRLGAHDVLFLANVGTLSAAERGNVRRFVEDGGSVIISFGDQVNLAGFSQVLEDLGVGRIAQKVDAQTAQGYPAIIGDVDLRHPIFSLFASTGTGVIFRPAFREYVRVVPDSSAVVLGRYDAEDPFLLERELGQGRVLVYTSTFNTNWTDFPVHNMYVPFIYQMVRHALHAATTQQMFTVGDPVLLTGQSGETWDVRTPDDRLIKVDVDDFGTAFFRETDVPGHYTAARGRTTFSFSVNVDPRESDLTGRDAEEAYAALVPPRENVATDPQAATLAVEDGEGKQKFWRVILLLILALFAFETYYANRKAT